MHSKWAAAGLLIAVLAGCGGDDGEDATATQSPETAAVNAPAAPEIPAKLVGIWETSVPSDDIEDMPNEYIGASPRWTITIAESGGVDNAPSFSYANEKLGTLESFGYDVSDGKISLRGICEEYDAPQVYSYKVEGDELTLEVAESRCPDVKYLESLFTTKPFKKVG